MRDKKPLMKCGHVGEGVWDDEVEGIIIKRSCCPICFGLDPLSIEVAEDPLLDSRIAQCVFCKKETQSNQNLPFFAHIPFKAKDNYYCGCRGWN